jgi:hypothetical protein
MDRNHIRNIFDRPALSSHIRPQHMAPLDNYAAFWMTTSESHNRLGLGRVKSVSVRTHRHARL